MKYQRGPSLTKRQQQRLRRQQLEREKTMEKCQKLPEFFRNAARMPGKEINVEASATRFKEANEGKESAIPTPAIGMRRNMRDPEELEAAIADLEKALRSKTLSPAGQNATRHQAVLRFLYYQRARQDNETRQMMALRVANCFNRGKWFAEKLVSWEISWRRNRTIPKGKQGCFQKVKSWLTDEGVELAVREYLSGAGESK